LVYSCNDGVSYLLQEEWGLHEDNDGLNTDAGNFITDGLFDDFHPKEIQKS
jgi:hypothetical protein